MSLLDLAREYRDFGLRPLPFAYGGKQPIAKWQVYQTRSPTDAELESWWGAGQQTNIGAVVGPGLLVVDLDGGKPAEAMLNAVGIILPENAPRVLTGSGYHVYLSVPRPLRDKIGLLTTNNGKPQVDIRAAGCVVLPPSLHPNGKTYRWVVPLEGPPPPAPENLLDLIERSTSGAKLEEHTPGWATAALAGVNQGRRDSVCTQLAGFLLGKKLDAELVEELLARTFAPACRPPFPREDVRKTVQSIARRQGTLGSDRDVVPEHISRVAKRLLETLVGNPPKTYATGFKDLDWYLCGGMAGGELILLGARPGVGKTALALQIARNVAKAGSRVLIVSREMETLALVRRMVAQSGRIDAGVLRRAQLGEERLAAVKKVVEELDPLPIWMTDQATTLEEIVGMVENSQARNEGCLVVVDHLQLVRVPGGDKDKRAQVEAVSQGLKTLALQYKIPVLCMSTLSRPFDKKNPKPGLDSLRESGELEHDADIVLLMHREFKSDEAECRVAKNRDGHLGPARLRFEAEYVLFSTLEDQADSYEPGRD